MTSIIFSDEAEAFLTKAIKQVKIRKAVINCILFSLPIILCAYVIYNYIFETGITGTIFLNIDKYKNHLHTYFLPILVLFCLAFLFIIIPVILINKRLNRYLKAFTSLSHTDLLRLKAMNEHLFFYQRYLTPYIIRKQEIIVFKLFSIQYFNMSNIAFINLGQLQRRHPLYKLTVGFDNDKNKYSIGNIRNIFLAENLIKEVLAVNPKIKVKRWYD